MKKVIVALDNMDQEQVISFLSQADGRLSFVKIGLENYLRYGQDFVKKIANDYQLKVFLDLKLHDIPNTIAKAISALEGLPIEFLTLHLTGGREMLISAVEAKCKYLPDCQLLGVSYLTSLDEHDFKEIWNTDRADINEQFNRLFHLAHDTGIDGVVSSPTEVDLLKGVSKDLVSVTPGIRFSDEIKSRQLGDQKRVLDPVAAFEKGADFLVMGRSLTQATNLQERLKFLEGLT